MGRWQSGQMHQTVNLAPSGYGGSNPSLPTFLSRSSSVVERFLGKKEVMGSIPIFGSWQQKRNHLLNFSVQSVKE